MNILTQNTETLDFIFHKVDELSKETLINSLQNLDSDISSYIDRKRYRLIKNAERTILFTGGYITFKRRYYQDKYSKEYICPLDNVIGLPKYSRMTNELMIKIMDFASRMSYKNVGELVCPNVTFSKSTICRVIKNVRIEQVIPTTIKRDERKIHVQIDEKYIGVCGSTNKRKYYTATIFAGREYCEKYKNRLLNNTHLSGYDLSKLIKRINYFLKDVYKVRSDETIFVSGDLASYIQALPGRITVCNAIYVPDKFHVLKLLQDEISKELQPLSFQEMIQCMLNEFTNEETGEFIRNTKHPLWKLFKLYKSNTKVFKTWDNPEYLGCSQEGMNSHYYAPRFGKYASRFKPNTLEKLSLIIEAKANDCDIKIVYKEREIPEYIDVYPLDINDPDIAKYYIDTSRMKHETRKMFNKIKYGDYNF